MLSSSDSSSSVLVTIKRSERVMSCLRRGQPAEDDWELYEQAALQREMESDSEGEESEESGSPESLPTYGFEIPLPNIPKVLNF